MGPALLVGVGASAGALIRYGIMTIARPLNDRWQLPVTTLLINLSGAACLGWLLALSLTTSWQLFLGTGLLGGYTTFSTMINELVLLVRHHHRKTASYYVLLSTLGGLACAWLGQLLAFN
ncbi:fluoride efflux transporter FluC [Lactiplantibacillus modestisalitolerans]|uniref:Fluoride-specific ion channel FluC n=1 Tax=Lactiplantibacillus modestisalitolerans TaxID=1457219 RepID=A0ABV5WQX6_9LACO|nr:CrcB family protein [Lactiplantibacillus modestisalitolerans]